MSLPTVISLVGARPQFIKEAVINAAVRRRNSWRHILVHSGQHYYANMSEIFFTQLGMPTPDHFLGMGSGTHATQTVEALVKFEALLLQEKPDLVLLYGDTNTTVAGAHRLWLEYPLPSRSPKPGKSPGRPGRTPEVSPESLWSG